MSASDRPVRGERAALEFRVNRLRYLVLRLRGEARDLAVRDREVLEEAAKACEREIGRIDERLRSG